MDYNKVFELGPWPMNLLLCIYEEDDWSVLKKKLPTDYHGTLEYMLLTRFGEKPAEVIRMVFQEGLSVYDVAARFDRDYEGKCRPHMTGMNLLPRRQRMMPRNFMTLENFCLISRTICLMSRQGLQNSFSHTEPINESLCLVDMIRG